MRDEGEAAEQPTGREASALTCASRPERGLPHHQRARKRHHARLLLAVHHPKQRLRGHVAELPVLHVHAAQLRSALGGEHLPVVVADHGDIVRHDGAGPGQGVQGTASDLVTGADQAVEGDAAGQQVTHRPAASRLEPFTGADRGHQLHARLVEDLADAGAAVGERRVARISGEEGELRAAKIQEVPGRPAPGIHVVGHERECPGVPARCVEVEDGTGTSIAIGGRKAVRLPTMINPSTPRALSASR